MNVWLKIPALIFLPLMFIPAQAATVGGITVGGTRLIYDGARREASLSVSNSDIHPYLIQSWVETLEGRTEKSPFIVTPPLFRLEGSQQDLLRVVRTGSELPADRESLYWLNIKSIPASSKHQNTNTLQIAVKTRIKLIYRPEGLKGVPEDMAGKLTWSHSDHKLTVFNPTPFVMNFNQVKVGSVAVKEATYVLPMSSATFAEPLGANGSLSWSLITDYGGVGAVHTVVSGELHAINVAMHMKRNSKEYVR